MTTQPEQILENNLVTQLEGLSYKKVVIKDEQDLVSNFKTQLEKHNKVSLNDKEFKQILNPTQFSDYLPIHEKYLKNID